MRLQYFKISNDQHAVYHMIISVLSYGVQKRKATMYMANNGKVVVPDRAARLQFSLIAEQLPANCLNEIHNYHAVYLPPT